MMRLKATLRLHTGQETKREPLLGLSCAAGDGCGAGRLREDARDQGFVGMVGANCAARAAAGAAIGGSAQGAICAADASRDGALSKTFAIAVTRIRR